MTHKILSHKRQHKVGPAIPKAGATKRWKTHRNQSISSHPRHDKPRWNLESASTTLLLNEKTSHRNSLHPACADASKLTPLCASQSQLMNALGLSSGYSTTKQENKMSSTTRQTSISSVFPMISRAKNVQTQPTWKPVIRAPNQ